MKSSWKLYPTQVKWGREQFQLGVRQCEIARALNLSESTVWAFLIGWTHKEVGGPIVIPQYIKK